jgi:hypothetical protein
VNEAGAAENIYRLSQGLGDVNGGDFRKAAASYLKAAIEDDWPAMSRDEPGAQGAKQALDAIYRMLSVVNDERNRSIVGDIFRQLDRLTESRRSRLIAAEGGVPDVIWLMLLGGAVVTIAFALLLRHGKSSGADRNDCATGAAHICRTFGRGCDRPAVCGGDQGAPQRA